MLLYSESCVSSNLKLPRIELPKFNDDVLNFKTSGISLKLQCITMLIYQMVRNSYTMYNPLGLISPFTVRAKILFQELWLKGLHWDDPLDGDIKAKWLSWKSTLATFIGKALTTNFSNLAFTTAAKSSSLGRDTLMGATLDFDITSYEDTLPCLSLIRMYTAAPYPLREASPKPCTSTAESCVIPFPKHRGIVTSFSCNNSVCWFFFFFFFFFNIIIYNTYITYNTYVTTNITYNTIVTYTTITNTTNTTDTLPTQLIKQILLYILL